MALIASRLHLVWIATVCGKLKTDYRYSNTLGWNTFPVPTLTEKNKADLTRCAEDILLAREHHFPATIADLYDPEAMPADLRAAHERNDEVLERIYIGRRFKNDTERLEKLFDLYTKMTGKRLPASANARRRRRRTLAVDQLQRREARSLCRRQACQVAMICGCRLCDRFRRGLCSQLRDSATVSDVVSSDGSTASDYRANRAARQFGSLSKRKV